MPTDDANVRIIKGRRLRTTGTRRLGAPPTADPGGEEPRARIIEQSGRAVAVEVACTCGKKIYLQLDCAGAPDAPPAEQVPAPAAPVSADGGE